MAPASPTPVVANDRGFCLVRDGQGRLGLHAGHHVRVGDVVADWLGPEQLRRLSGGKKQLLARAVGIGKRTPLSVLDATGGLGRDAHVMAHLGATVTVCERQPLIFALLQDAWARLELVDDRCASRLRLQAADAHSVLRDDLTWDVVYLDPMYPGRDKTALPGKEMQFFRELTEGDADAGSLLALARARARWRVVVKRPLSAPPLADQAPDQSLRGTQARFDLYLVPPPKETP